MLALLWACTPSDPEVVVRTVTVPVPEDSPTVPVDDPETCAGRPPAARPIPLTEACDIAPVLSELTPAVEWRLRGHNGFGPPVVGQLDDDDRNGVIDQDDDPDLVYVPTDRTGLVVVNGRTGRISWTNWAVTDPASGVALGDLDGDGRPEIVAADGPGRVVALDARGEVLWATTFDRGPLMYWLYPSIADLDGDGLAEVIAGRTILDARGEVVAQGSMGVGASPGAVFVDHFLGAIPVAADLDGDGTLEVVTGNAAYRPNGSVKFSNLLSDGIPAVADFDGDGLPEVVTTSGDTVRTLESDLSLTGWSARFEGAENISAPAIDDLDGDGVPDFVVAGADELRAYRWDGSLLWTSPVDDIAGAAGPITYDFEGDGIPEVVYADQSALWVFDGLAGEVELREPDHDSSSGFETPVVADIDGDGLVEIALLHSEGPDGLTVYGDDTWPEGRSVWNQHAYAVPHVGDDLSIPAAPAPSARFRSGTTAPPPPTGDAAVDVLGVCLDECPDSVRMVVRFANPGADELPAGLPWVVRAGRRVVARGELEEPIPSGWTSEGLSIRLDPAEVGDDELRIELEAAPTECDPSNNAVGGIATCG